MTSLVWYLWMAGTFGWFGEVLRAWVRMTRVLSRPEADPKLDSTIEDHILHCLSLPRLFSL